MACGEHEHRGDLPITPRVKVFLSTRSMEGVFGGGKWMLLTAVREEGSLRKAAARLGRSYRKAWGDIKRAEEGLGHAIVTRVRGGAHGGGSTVLTEFGQRLLDVWEQYQARVRADVGRHYQQLLEPLFNGEGDHGRSHESERNNQELSHVSSRAD